MKITYNGGYYIIEDGKRQTGYLASAFAETTKKYREQIAHAERALADLQAIEDHLVAECAKRA